MMQAVLFLMYLVLATNAQSCSYSSLCSDHTMCKYQQGYAAACGNPIYSGVTSSVDKQTIVDAHNNLRRQVAQGKESRGTSGAQPSAANMRKMSWDDELASVAQRWTNQCNFGHDACRNVGRFLVGQNAYKFSSPDSSPNGQQDWKSAVQAWYNEVKVFNRNDISPFKFSLSTGHYTQVVWADTYKVGCGFTAYKASNGWYDKYYVCNYGPTGNWKGESMYKTGSACSKCSGACDNGLCV
uniref:Putative Venom allergen 1 n=1 Tax=Reticulitermes speratus TaxID=60591 RepID=A0A1V1FKT6_9NEOP